ncbi:MAG: FKBP-type peptidyl-prolyl cis-trans isomerase [Acidobacteriota bacterium]|nr:FKBP-type peptidyl-prolyl cis-trans isomerase [Acidobacteriota bacterium]
MRLLVGFVLAGLLTGTAAAQTAAKPAVHHTATRHAAAQHHTTGLPPGVPVVHGVVKTAFALRYQDYKVGTGAAAEPGKLVKVFYTVWIASDGRLLDSTDQHREELKDAEGKPELDADGKPKLGEPQPFVFMLGMTHLIPGFAEGFEGMRVGGKRRLFIPWQLAYGASGKPGPDAAHPGVPPKADLIFDIELLDATDAPMMNGGTMMPGGHPGGAMPPGHPKVDTHPPTETHPQEQ